MNFSQAKRKPFTAALAVMLLLVFGYVTTRSSVAMAPKSPMHAAGQNDNLDFTIVNKTGYKIKKVMIAKTSDPQWSADDDVMDGDTFDNDTELHITFSPKEHSEHWDMKVVYSIDGSSHEWDDLNLTGISKITLHYDADANSTHADIE